MCTSLPLRCLTITLTLACATSSALAQLGATSRRNLVANPPRATLGTRITLFVRGAPQGATYRFVASKTHTGLAASGARVQSCASTVTIGTGSSVTWQPVSGTYRLTAYGPVGHQTDTLTLAYVLPPRVVMLASAQSPGPGDSVRLMLRTDDLGPGHVYDWSMRYRSPPPSVNGIGQPTGPPPTWSAPWLTQTNGPMASYPKLLDRPPQSIEATVGIHRGNPCEIIAAGAMGPNQ
jgi:hypothetical protein